MKQEVSEIGVGVELASAPAVEVEARPVVERPILFSGPMVKAILEGRKTQTRRVVKMDDHIREFAIRFEADQFWQWNFIDKRFPNGGVKYPFTMSSPYGKPGDRLWVRETWGITARVSTDCWDHLSFCEIPRDLIDYRGSTPDVNSHWKPSIHMPRRFSRITLEITNVRVERLQEISGRDAVAEGMTLERWNWDEKEQPEIDIGVDKENLILVDKFRRLWNKINGKKHPWESNPWVWVVEFGVADTSIERADGNQT